MTSSSNINDEVQSWQESELETFRKPSNRTLELFFSCQGCGQILKTMTPMVNTGGQKPGVARHIDCDQFRGWRSVHRLLMSCRLQTVSCDSVSSGGDVRDKRSSRMISQLKEFKMLEEEVETYIAAETGMDRIRRVLSIDPVTQQVSPEVQFVRSAMIQIIGVFSVYGFITEGKAGKQMFLKRNKSTQYATKSMANKRMYNTMIQSGMKGSFRWVLKGGTFIVPPLIMERGLSVYYNKTSPVHMMAAFGTMGCLVKISLGPKGMFAGGVIGSVLGLAFGALWTCVCTMMGETQDILTHNSVRSRIERQRSYQRPVVPEEGIADEDL